MVVIIEGIDRVGKTTLANKIVKASNGKLRLYNGDFRYAGSAGNILVNSEKLNSEMAFLEAGVDDIIFDRFFLSELVYGLLDRDYTNYSAFDIYRRLCALKQDVCLILVRPTDICKSSSEHGSNLAFHDACFKQHFDEFGGTLYKFECNYNTLNSVVDYLSVRW